MSNAEEAGDARTELAGDLAAGVQTLSLNQDITFTKYVKLILPLDGFVFWVKADLLSASALFNASQMNMVRFNQAPRIITPAPTLTVKGSLHYATEMRQEETETYAANRVIFTALSEVQDLNEIGPNELFIGTFQGIRFAFSNRGSFYRQAQLYHYTGYAIYPDMETQIIDNPASIDRSLIVSNSLPMWLGLNGYKPFYGFGNPSLKLYPSFLVDQNIRPPFASVHIFPESTEALGSAQLIDPRSSLSQLMSDRVRVTMYGVRNAEAMDFVACVNQYSVDYDAIGIMNMPAIRDEKRSQSEMNTISIKKSVEFVVSYYQARSQDIARQLILSCIPTFIIDGFVPPTPPEGHWSLDFSKPKNSFYIPMGTP